LGRKCESVEELRNDMRDGTGGAMACILMDSIEEAETNYCREIGAKRIVA